MKSLVQYAYESYQMSKIAARYGFFLGDFKVYRNDNTYEREPEIALVCANDLVIRASGVIALMYVLEWLYAKKMPYMDRKMREIADGQPASIEVQDQENYDNRPFYIEEKGDTFYCKRVYGIPNATIYRKG